MSRLISRLAAIVALWLAVRAGKRQAPSQQPSQRQDDQLDNDLDSEANLLAMVSHDLRTPLTSVKGFAQLLLRDSTASESSRRYAEIILAETNRTIRTIDDVADLARTREDADDIDVRPVDLAPTIARAVEGVRHQDPDRRIRVVAPTSLGDAKADPLRVERIVANLITTVLRYSTGADPVEVGATTGDRWIDIWVRDAGDGIPVEKYAHIFDLASTSGVSRGESLNGSGLGLYISKRLVEAQGGTIWVEEDAGRGKGFRFRLAAAA